MNKTKLIVGGGIILVLVALATIGVLVLPHPGDTQPETAVPTQPTDTSSAGDLHQEAIKELQNYNSEKAIELLEKEKAIYEQEGETQKAADVDALIDVAQEQPPRSEPGTAGSSSSSTAP